MATKKPTKVLPEWYHLKTFTNVKDHDDYMKQAHFAGHKTEDSSKHTIRYMRCNRVRKAGKQCAARLRVKLSKSEVTWVVLENRIPHTCAIINNRIQPVVRERARCKTDAQTERIPPKKALALAIEEFGEDAPTLGQIYHLNRIEDAQNTVSFSVLGNLVEWLIDHTTQTTDEELFVLNYRHSDIGAARTDIQYVVSTPQLLKIVAEFRIISVDATYKVNEHDYPVIFVGGIDLDQKLHIIAYSVTSREETSNYSFVFDTLKTMAMRYQKEFNPQILISDAAGAIAKAFKETFPGDDKKIVMCWFHMKQAIVKKLGSNEHREEVIGDIDKIHISHSQAMIALCNNNGDMGR